jgi:restriction system protein
MNSLDAAYVVLKEEKGPLHVKEITNRILDKGLWETNGKTPDATVTSKLNSDINTHAGHSRFIRLGNGIFGLNETAAAVEPVVQLPVNKPEQPKVNDEKTNLQPTVKSEKVDSKPIKTLSFSDAAEHVLEHIGKRKPIHYKVITEEALNLGLITTAGLTPEMKMNAQIMSEINRMMKRGEQPRFVKHGKGYFGLSRWLASGLAFQIEQHNKEVRDKLHEYISAIKPAEFESLVGRLLTAMGFDLVSVTPLSNDGGIDVRGTLIVGDSVRIKMAVQVKRWKKNVQAPVVQQVRGSLGAHEQGLIITTSDFSRGAYEEAERSDATPVALMNGKQVVNLLIENDICIRRFKHDLIELGEEEED